MLTSMHVDVAAADHAGASARFFLNMLPGVIWFLISCVSARYVYHAVYCRCTTHTPAGCIRRVTAFSAR
eukprot:60505-Chlamydomonas_euryale.AAC.1